MILFILIHNGCTSKLYYLSYILSHCPDVLFNLYPEQQTDLPFLKKTYKNKSRHTLTFQIIVYGIKGKIEIKVPDGIQPIKDQKKREI